MRPKTPDELRKALRTQMKEDIAAGVLAGTKTIDEAVQETNARLVAIDERVKAIEDNSRRQDLPGSGDEGRGENYEGRFNFGSVFRSLMLKSLNEPESVWRGAAETEWEMNDSLRAQATTPDSLGGFLVPGQVLIDQVIPLLRPRLIAVMLGATEADFISTPVDIPREVTDPVTEALAENATQTASDAVLGNMRLEPHRAQAYIEASRRLFFTGPGAQKVIINMMTRRMAVEINGWTLNGTGGLEPTGIINTSGIGSVDFSGVTIGANDVPPTFYQTMLLFEERLADADAWEGAIKLGWAMPTKVKRAIRQIKSDDLAGGGAGTVLRMNPQSIFDGTAKEILGDPYAVTTQLASGTEAELLYGDWETVIMATFGNMILETSNVAGEAMRQGQTHIVSALEVDVALTQPGAFAVSSGLDMSSF